MLGFTDYPAIFEDLNEQHRAIAGSVAELESALVAEELARARPIMLSLLKTLKRHFRREERVMRNLVYPGYRPHKAHHEESLGKLEDFLRAFDEHGVVELAKKYAKTYRAQLEEDVEIDKDLGEFLNRQEDHKGHTNAWWSATDPPDGPHGF